MPEPTPAETYFALFNEIGILEQLSRAVFEARLPKGFVLGQFAVLNHLVRVRDGRTPLELARAFQVPKTTMTHSLAVLDRHGLIRMEANPQDGRSKRVWITEDGRTFRERAIADLGPDLLALNAQFPVQRVAPLVPALADLRRVMDAMRDAT
ncbi:MAG: MarR family transcriptional regulator [Paracoccaceae bacterium]|nr:MAG: MarR family transcriptional regulator [Paracoccaceae bacterium]